MRRFRYMPFFVFGVILSRVTFGLELKPVLMLNMASASVSPAVAGLTYSSKTGFSFGALVEFDLNPLTGLESGILLAPYGTKATVASTSTVTEGSWKMLQIPLVLRFNLIPMLSVGAGGYFAIAMGSTADTSTTVGTAAPTSGTSALDSAAKSDFGILASAAFKMPIGPLFDAFLDARYIIGLKNQEDTAGVTTKINHFQVLAGVALGL